MPTIRFTHLDTPIGPLLVAAGPAGLKAIRFPVDGRPAEPDPGWAADPDAAPEALVQLREYFDGRRQAFEFALDPDGTSFQRSVWALLAEIPFGRTTTYGALAERLGRRDAVRAVGAANGRNPLPIVVPCHRVVGSDGSLTGYAGGLDVKRALLQLEGVDLPEQLGLF